MIQPKLSRYCCGPPGKGIPLFRARQFAAAATAWSLIAGAFFVLPFAVVDAQAKGPPGTCEDAAEVAVLPSPIAPWKGAPLRVVVAAEKPLEGELSLIAPDGKVVAKSRERQGGPPYFWFAEVTSPVAGTWQAKLTSDRAGECGTITRDIAVRDDEPPRPRRGRRQRLAVAQYLEPRDGKPVFGMDREAVRRAARRGAVVAGAARSAARSIAQFPVRPSGPARRRDRDDRSPRLRRPAVLPARLFRLQDGIAVRLLEVLARRRRPAAEVLRVVEQPDCCRRRQSECCGGVGQSECRGGVFDQSESRAGQAAGARGVVRPIFADRRRRRPFRVRANGGGRQQHRLLSRAADAGDAAPGDRVRRSVWARLDAGQARAAVGRARPASSSPSTGSPTARSRASVFGAAISCSCTIPRSVDPGSSASGRSCARRAARCGG